MLSLTSLILAILLFVSPCLAYGEGGLGLTCAKSAIPTGYFFQIDEKNKRIFIAIKRIKEKELKALIQKLHTCFDNDHWKDQWSLSVFSERRFVGYKDEPHIVPFHKRNEWAKGYLAEYYSHTGSLTLTPALSPHHIVIK